MEFDEKEQKEISDFILKYNSDDNFRKDIEQTYLSNLSKLSILQIYALEEILRFNKHNFYAKNIEKFKRQKRILEDFKFMEEQNQFIELYKNNPSFKEYKDRQYSEQPETLSAVEKLALKYMGTTDISNVVEYNKELSEILSYDPLVPILYDDDEGIKATILNLLIGRMVFEMLKRPEYSGALLRQKAPGVVANIDKEIIIDNFYETLINTYEATSAIVMQKFYEAKKYITLGLKDLAYKDDLRYRTNISAEDILTYKKANNKTK